MSGKPGFMIYHNDMKALMGMSDKDLGQLLKLLYQVSIGEEPDPPARLRIIFDMLAERVREDSAHYEEKIEKRRKAGQASAEARERQHMSTHVDTCQHMSTNTTQLNTTQHNSTQYNTTQHNTALNYPQRDDDMNEVMTEM